MFQQILVPVDGSIASGYALEQALQIAARQDTVITALCVIDTRLSHEDRVYLPMQSEIGVSTGFLSPQQVTLTYQAWADQVSTQAVTRGAAVGVKVQAEIVRGIPYQEIITRTAPYDLLVMGTWQTSWMYPGPFLAGQTLWQVIAHTRLPILYVPSPPKKLQTILVAYDDSREAQDVLQLTATWAHAWQLTLVVLTVQPDGRQAQALLRKARRRAQPAAPRLVARDGQPTKAIISITSRYNCDLIALGVHLRWSLFGYTPGRVTNSFLHASHLPVLLSH